MITRAQAREHAFITPTPPEPGRPGSRFAARLGSEAALDDVLAVLAADCRLYERNAKPRAYEARCGIRFADLWTSGRPPPEVPPGAPALRVVGGRG